MKVQNINKVQAVLKARHAALGSERASVVVSFTQNYAIYVHEDMTANHTVGQAKYLEQPARQMGKQLGKMVSENMKRGLTLEKSLLVAGLLLQREAQKLCPIDTGALRASANTVAERV